MDDQSAAGDCTPADRSSSPWQLCWYFCWYSLNQYLDKTKKSLKKSSFIWRLPGPPSGYFFSVLIIHDYFSYLFQAILQL